MRMRYVDIDFPTIMRLNTILDNCKRMISINHPALKNTYLQIDEEMMKCLTKHRTLHSDLRYLDFIRLTERDFVDKSYIHNRLSKMDKGFKLLMNMYRG